MRRMQPTALEPVADRAFAPRRSGVTLTEVLTSIMIMGLGVTFVISLFPVAMLRSLKASQLTNAALTRLNAEATIDLLPGIIHDPDGDGDTREHFRFGRERHYVIDPWGYTVHWIDGSPALAVPPAPRVESYRDWFGNTGAEPTLGGNPTSASPNGYPTALPSIPRFDGGLFNSLGTPTATIMEREAAALVASRDGWVDHVDVEIDAKDTNSDGVYDALIPHPISGKIIAIDLPGADLSSLPTNGTNGAWSLGIDSRIVLYSETGRVSASYPITAFDTATGRVTWSEDFVNSNGSRDAGEDRNSNGELEVRGLSDDFLEGGVISVSRVVLEVSKQRLYSWLLTVRKGSDGQAGVDVVVVFNRGVDPENERAFPATFVAQSNQVYVMNSGSDKPKLKRGGFVFDVVNARWYRVQGIDEPPLVGAWAHGSYDYVLRVNRDIIEQAGEDLDLTPTGGPAPNGTLDAGEDVDGDGALDFGSAIFLPGVVDVYPLGTKTLPESAL